MRDPYKILGLPKESSESDIKKAYRRLAVASHPDKGGNTEQMKLLNEAYEILSDRDKRKAFEKDWELFSSLHEEESLQPQFADFLDFKGVPYSSSYRKEHEISIHQYTKNPLRKKGALSFFQTFNSNLYRCENKFMSFNHLVSFIKKTENFTYFNDIFSLIEHNEYQNKEEQSLNLFSQTLTPSTIIEIFIDFLSGRYFANILREMNKYLSIEIEKLDPSRSPDILLYQGIYEITSLTKIPLA